MAQKCSGSPPSIKEHPKGEAGVGMGMLVAQPGRSCGDLRGSTRSTYICASWMILIQAFHRSPTRNGEARARCRPLGFPPTRVMSAGARNDFIRHPDGHISLCDPGTSRGRISSRHFNSRHPRAPGHAADAAAPRPKEKRRLESSTHHPGRLPCRLVRGQRGVGATSHLKAVRAEVCGPRGPAGSSRRRIRAASGGAEARFGGQNSVDSHKAYYGTF